MAASRSLPEAPPIRFDGGPIRRIKRGRGPGERPLGLSLLLWPLGTGPASMALVIMPWALGCFASNSAQQARLSMAAPALTAALVALNSSAMYAGQALGASSGGLVVAQAGFGPLHWIGLAWMVCAIALSLWAARRMAGGPRIAAAHG